MMTLHDTIELTKKVIIFGVLGVIGIFILIGLFRFGGFLKEQFFPTPPPAALSEFGKLPPIAFKDNNEKNDSSYELDTLSGTYPDLGDRTNVYKIVQSLPAFYDLTRAKTKAKIINLTVSPVPTAENIYQWTESGEPQRKLVMNVVTTDFTLTSSYQTYQPVLSGAGLPDQEKAIEVGKGFLESIDAYPDTINEASTSARTFSLQDRALVETTSLQNAQVIRVDFYHSEVNGLPIYYPSYPNSLIYTLIGSGGPFRPIILEAGFTNHIISEEFSDYPLKTSEQAFKELEEGKGYIVFSPGDEKEIKIKDIQLGYYMSEEQQEYLMPIFIFFGDGFLAYVTAVSDEFIQ